MVWGSLPKQRRSSTPTAQAETNMTENMATAERIDSWKEISAYLGRDVSTVIRWEKDRGLPVHRIPGGQRQGVFAFRNEIDNWLRGGSEVYEAKVDNDELPPQQEESIRIPDEAERGVHVRRKTHSRCAGILAASLVLLGIAIFGVRLLTSAKRIQFSGISQLTDDGTLKRGLVTDGVQIYFDELRDGKTILVSVPVAGGPVRTISTFLRNDTPQSMSPDGKRLLVLNQDGKEEERSLWIVPVSGQTPTRVGTVHCHSASWSPGGNQIAFATGSAIYLTSDEGKTQRLIHEFAAVPERVQWSSGNGGLQFQLRDIHTGQFTLWTITLSPEKDTYMESLTPLNVAFSRNGAYLATLDDAGHAFVSVDNSLNGSIALMTRARGLTGTAFHLHKVNAHVSVVGMLAIDRRSRQLFALGGNLPGVELFRYDPSSRNASPFLPGLSARDLDYSRDGQWLTYVKLKDRSLWVSRSDGSETREICAAAVDTELPRWSPDGKQIAFMRKTDGNPWRIYFISASGGPIRQASVGTDNQGAPTWSPDGKRLVYGNVKCQELDACAIHEIEVSTGKESTIPGSEGLATARWSPNGRYIGALQPKLHQIYVLDLAKQRWRKLADEVTGDDLAWAKDSHFLYASSPIGKGRRLSASHLRTEEWIPQSICRL